MGWLPGFKNLLRLMTVMIHLPVRFLTNVLSRYQEKISLKKIIQISITILISRKRQKTFTIKLSWVRIPANAVYVLEWMLAVLVYYISKLEKDSKKGHLKKTYFLQLCVNLKFKILILIRITLCCKIIFFD